MLGYANPATVLPIAHVHSSTPSMSSSEKRNDSSDQLLDASKVPVTDVEVSSPLDFPTVPTHPVCLNPRGQEPSQHQQETVEEAEDVAVDKNQGLESALKSSILSEVNNRPPVIALPVKVDPNPLAIVRYLRMLVRFSPEPLSSYFAKLEPTVNKWASAIHFFLLSIYIFLEILLELAIEVWTVLKPYRPELLLPSFAGLVMCFFGGSFVTTIAAAEAYRLVGYESTRECLKTLIEEFNQVLQAAEKDAEMGIDDIEPSCDSSKG